MHLDLYTLTGEFRVERTVVVATATEARAIIEKHLEGSGYTNLKMADCDGYSTRYTARTPGGRGGRNVANLDLE